MNSIWRTSSKLLFIISYIIIASCSENAGITETKMIDEDLKIIDTKLDVLMQGKDIVAELRLKNLTDEKVQLDKYKICLDGKLTGDFFEIITKSGKEIEYTGKVIKRIISEDDFYELLPGAVISSKVILNAEGAYDFPSDENDYLIKFSVFNSSYPGEDSELLELESNEVVMKI